MWGGRDLGAGWPVGGASLVPACVVAVLFIYCSSSWPSPLQVAVGWDSSSGVGWPRSPVKTHATFTFLVPDTGHQFQQLVICGLRQNV